MDIRDGYYKPRKNCTHAMPALQEPLFTTFGSVCVVTERDIKSPRFVAVDAML
jgi:hypothetical protein